MSDPSDAQNRLAELNSQLQRPARSINIDGSFELGWASMLLLSGFIPYLSSFTARSHWSGTIGFVALLGMAFAPYAIPKVIKRFITWPRTGYVANPNELKFSQLVLIMLFGGALGGVIGMVLVYFTGPKVPGHGHPGLQLVAVLLCSAAALYLGKKVIRKRRPQTIAYDSAQLNRVFNQTEIGRKTMRVVKGTMLAVFLGAPILIGLLVLGAMWLSKSVSKAEPMDWLGLGVMGLLVICNVMLYLMCNAPSFRQRPWKWAVAATLVIAPVFAARVIPFHPASEATSAVLHFMPPPFTISIGVLWFVSGALTLCLFIRQNPISPAEAE